MCIWASDGNGLAGKGEKVFRYDEKAIREIHKINGDVIEAVIGEIVALDETLALAATKTAQEAGADITKAERSMAKALDALARGDEISPNLVDWVGWLGGVP